MAHFSAWCIEKQRQDLWLFCDSEKGRRCVLEVLEDIKLFHVCEKESEIAREKNRSA
jgi:hypothetical protein